MLAGCSDTGTLTGVSPATAVRERAAAEPQDAAHQVARAIALALAQPAMRAAVRDGMRDSRLVDHKLVLQDFVESARGRALVAAAAAATHADAESLLAGIRALPRLDFYLPFRAHRITWRATNDVVVGVAFEKFAPSIQAFATDGSARTLHLSDADAGAPVIVLHPAEIALARPASMRSAGGETVQDAGENGTVRWTTPAAAAAPASTSTLEPGAPNFLYDTCDPDGLTLCDYGPVGTTSTGGSVPPGVYLVAWDAARGDGWWGSLELQFRSYAYNTASYSWLYAIWIFDSLCPLGTAGVTSDGTHHDGLILVSPGVSRVGSSYLSCNGKLYRNYELQVVEIDGGTNASDDDFGRRLFDSGIMPHGGVIAPAGSPWTASWQDYYSGSGMPATSTAYYSISLALQYR